jgi:hypothetical protein
VRDLVLLDELGHGEFAMWLERGAVVEDEGCAGSKAGDEPMPHHPCGGRVEEDTGARCDGAVKYMFLFMLKKCT